jgi:hypothetical protein
MGPRSWLSLCVLVITVVLVACSSPGDSFAYKDLRISLGPSATPAQPVIGQSTTLAFTLRNTWNQPLTGVAWELRETTSGSVVLTNGTVDLAAFGSSAHSFVITSPTQGTHTYTVVIDPLDAVNDEQDEGNNTSEILTLVVADQEIAFGSPAPAVTWPTTPNTTDQPTLSFVISNTVDSDQPSPAASISVPFSVTLAGNPVGTPTPSSPATVNADGTTAVSVLLPATGSAGSFVYTITLSPADGDDQSTGNNTATVTVVIPASG